MNTKRLATHLYSVVILLLWGGVMLYFHLSGRMAAYLPQSGIFRPMALYAGIALVALGLFNLATIGAEDLEASTPEEVEDHAHGKEGGCQHCKAVAATVEEPASPGRWLALLILALPLLIAAVFSPDRFSPAAIINKGLYTAKYDTKAAPPPTRLGSAKPATLAKTAPVPAPLPAPAPPRKIKKEETETTE